MKKLSFVLAGLVSLVVRVGFYRGWFALSRQSGDTESDKGDINLTVDRGKVKEDVEEVKRKTTDRVNETAAEAKDLGNRAKDKVKSR